MRKFCSNVKSFDHYKTDEDRYQKINGVDILKVDTEEPVGESLNRIIRFIEDLKAEKK